MDSGNRSNRSLRTGCIGGCDDTLRQLTEICGTGSRGNSGVPARGRGSTPAPTHLQRSNIRQTACVHCRQMGHSSSDCPSQVSRSRIARSHGNNFENGDASIPCSSCGMPCTLKTANTANNRGRKFYSCQPQCNFFVWEDSLGNNTGGRGASRGSTNSSASNPAMAARGGGRRGGFPAGRDATTFVSATGEPISDRRCFACGDPSHFANVCPNRVT